jgi:hypothetical protein
MNKRHYPLKLSKDIQRLINYIKLEVVKNENFIESVESKDYFIQITDKLDERFYFRVYKPNQNNNLVSFFNFQFAPENENSLKPLALNNNFDHVASYFQSWLKIVKEYNDVTFTETDYFTKKYEEEFYADFEIIEEDAETNPFEHNKQIFLYNLLEYVERELQKNEGDEEITHLISETTELKNNLQNLTKKVVIRKMSIIFSKVKKKGLKLFSDIIDVAKKEIIKKALYGGIQEIDHLTNYLW